MYEKESELSWAGSLQPIQNGKKEKKKKNAGSVIIK